MKRLIGISIGILCIFCLLFVAVTPRDVLALDATKTATTELLGWTEIAQGAVQESAEFNVSENLQSDLHIITCLSSTTAHTGTEVIVFTGSSSADDDWTELTRYSCCVGTAIKIDLGGDEAAAQTVLTVTDPVTNNLDNDGKWVFLEHTGTIANCELVYQTDNSGDAGDTVTVLDGLTHAQTAAASDFYTIDSATGSVVNNKPVSIPESISRVKVVWNNNYDPDGSTVHVMARGTAFTDIE